MMKSWMLSISLIPMVMDKSALMSLKMSTELLSLAESSGTGKKDKLDLIGN